MKNRQTLKMAMFLLLLLSQILFFLGYRQVIKVRDRVWLTVLNSSDSLMIDSYSEALGAAKGDLALVEWVEKYDQVSAEQLNKQASATIISTSERADILFFECSPFDSSYPNTCVVSRKLAKELFGLTNVKKLNIAYNGQSYRIVDVINIDDNLFICYKGRKSEEVFSEVTISNSDHVSPKMLKDKFEEKTGTTMRYVDYYFPLFLYESLFVLFIFYVGICIIKKVRLLLPELLKEKEGIIGRREVFNIKKCILGIIIIITGLLICCQFEGASVDIIPTRMSNKEFWIELIHEQKENLKFLFTKKRLYPELSFYRGQLLVISGLVVYALSWLGLWKEAK